MSMTEQSKKPALPAADGADGADEPLSRSAERHHQAATAMSDRVRALSLDKSEAPGGARGRKWLWIVGVAVLAAAAVWGKGLYQKLAAGGSLAGPEVDAIVVSLEQPAEIVLDAAGYVIARSTVKVSPNIPGTVVELLCDEGAEVKVGDVLARLDNTQYRADLEQAQASLDLAKARLQELTKGSRDEDIKQAQAALEQAEARRDLLKRSYQRAQNLVDTISASELDQAKSSFLQAEATVKQLASAARLVVTGPREEQIAAAAAEVERAQAMVDKTQYFVDCTRVTSPVAGTVVARNAELGERVVPESLAASMFQIADMSVLSAEIDVPERELANIHLGQPCVVTTEAYPGKEYEGRLDWFSPIFNRQRGVRRAKVTVLTPDEQLLPDMTCRVQVRKKTKEDAEDKMLVPQQAVIEDGDRKVVYVVRDECVERREVETGASHQNLVEIVKGLRTGEVLLLPGDEPITEGQKVRPRMRGGKNAAA